MLFSRPRFPTVFVAIVPLLVTSAPSDSLAQPPEGYRNYEQFRAHAEKVASAEGVELSVLGKTPEDRDIVLLTLSKGEAEKQPAILVVGSVEAESLIGSHFAMALAESFAKDGKLLDDITLYVIPRPSPDATERLFANPRNSSSVNSRPADDDRDGEVDEDPPEDLNNDGLITMMRVEDEAGEYIAHPEEPRVLVKADPAKGERGAYRLLTEGVDNDGDEAWNEDGPGGVDFNRNFTFRYPYFEPGAGPHQVSEPESRAVADFAYDHPNIFLVFSFAPQDNLNHVWKPKSGDERIKRSVQKEDEKYFQRIADRYQELTKPLDLGAAPDAADGQGALVPWAYFHYGRWSVATRGWWPPKQQEADEEEDNAKQPEPDANESESPPNNDSPEKAKKDSSNDKPKPDKRAADERRRLAWLDSAEVDGFAAWAPIEHPDFPGKKVEVGGFVPGRSTHPPAESLDAKPFVELIGSLVENRAKVALLSAKGEPLDGGVVRVTAEVVNRGGMPTASAMGELSRQLQRLEVELKGPKDLQVLDGPLRQHVGVLAPGEVAKRRWLVRLPEGATASDLELRTGEPSVGFDERKVEVDQEQTP